MVDAKASYNPTTTISKRADNDRVKSLPTIQPYTLRF